MRRYPLAMTRCVIVTLLSATCVLHAQTDPLTMAQIQQLIATRAPDNVLAIQITKRGLAFAPDPTAISKLRDAGAGPKTLAAINSLPPRPIIPKEVPPGPAAPAPSLDQARRTIPTVLEPLYKALNDGNASAAASFLSPQLAADARKLDLICKPYTYRAHLIESITERPGALYECRTRVLLTPTDEEARTIVFARSANRYVAVEVREADTTWFAPLLAATTDLARKFWYAARGQNTNVLSSLLAPGVTITGLYAPDVRRYFQAAESMEARAAQLVSLKGLRGRIELRSSIPPFPPLVIVVDRVGDDYKIVAWELRLGNHTSGSTDPDLESYTLARFGLAAMPANTVTNAAAEYDTLLNTGATAIEAGDYTQALNALLTATGATPARSEAWALLGFAYLATAQYPHAAAAWTHAIDADGSVTLNVRHEKTFDSEAGQLTVQTRAVSFIRAGQQVFSVAPATISDLKVSDGQPRLLMRTDNLGHWAYFRLKADRNNYNLDFVPLGQPAKPRDWYLAAESAEALAQQRAVAAWVIATIQRLAEARN